MAELPTGTVTFLFTDIEGSTRLLQDLGDEYRAVQDLHSAIVRGAIAETGGTEIRTEGDSFFVAFRTPATAARAAVAAQRGLARAAWPHGRPLRVRMGLHTDWSPAMIERFEARVREEGLKNAEGRVMDVHALEFENDAFDVTGSQFGVMLVPDQPLALREMVRVTRPGARVVVIAYRSPDGFEALQVFIGALRAVVPEFAGLPDDPPPLEFQLSDPDEFARRLIAAGLKEVRVEGHL